MKKGTLMHHESFCKVICQEVLKVLKVGIPFEPTIPLLEIYPEMTQRNTSKKIHINVS